jgi:hypothetical protein
MDEALLIIVVDFGGVNSAWQFALATLACNGRDFVLPAFKKMFRQVLSNGASSLLCREHRILLKQYEVLNLGITHSHDGHVLYVVLEACRLLAGALLSHYARRVSERNDLAVF